MSAPFRIEEVKARIEAQVPDLAGELREAGEFAETCDNLD